MPNKRIVKERRGDKLAIFEAKLTKLRRDNTRLRAIIDDIWNVVTDSDSAWSESKETVCELISNSFPQRHKLPEEPEPGDVSHDAAVLFEAAEEKKLTEMVASDMGLTVEEFSQSKDVDAKLMALRRILFREWKIDKDPNDGLTDQDYLSLVAGNLIAAVGLAANFPLSLKAETARFINALEIIHRGLDKGKRQPSADVRAGLKMLEDGHTLNNSQSLEAICQVAITAENGYEKNYSDMLPNEKRSARRKLHKRLDSLLRNRKERAIDAAVKVLENNGGLEGAQAMETICQQTISVQNGYGKNYSDLSDNAKRTAQKKLHKEIDSRLRRLRSRAELR